MSSKITTLAVLILVSTIGFCQNYQWTVSNSGVQNLEGLDIATDAAGNVYTVGQFSGTVDFDPGVSTFNLTSSNEAGYIQKLDSDGNLIWVKYFEQVSVANSNSQSLEIDAAGNLFVVGWFQGDVDFDPGVGVNTLVSNGIDQFIVKLDASGDLTWAKQYDAGTGYDNFQETAIDGTGNLFLCGRFSNTTDFNPGVGTNNLTPLAAYDGYILKLDNNGNFVWVKQFEGSSMVYPHGIAANNAGDVYTTGYFNSDIDMDPGIGTTASTAIGAKDLFMTKLNSNGDYQWGFVTGSSVDDRGVDVHVDPNGDPIFSGNFYATLDIEPGAGVTNLVGTGGYIVKMSPSGSLIWADKFETGLSALYAVTTNSTGSIYATGAFSGTGDFDPSAGTLNLTSSGMNDAFLLRLGVNGGLIWAANIGAASNDYGNAIASDATDNIYSVGDFRNTVDFDPGVGVSNLTANNTDIFIHKLGPCSAASITPDLGSLPDLNGECFVSEPVAPTATTDCGDVFSGTSNVTFPVTSQGTTVVTWTYDEMEIHRHKLKTW